MHCRYCFRQYYPYAKQSPGFDAELAYIADDASIEEVILSGGDPLSLSNERLQGLLEGLARIPHVRRVRFHSRFPIGIPERIDEGFLALLQQPGLQCFFVIHTNHAAEWDEDIERAMQQILRCGVPVLSQTVLLRQVNDSVEALSDLMRRLVNAGITPYYLHHLDPVVGSTHFGVEKRRGCWLLRELAKRLSGYALPRYVEEIPGQAHKMVITETIIPAHE